MFKKKVRKLVSPERLGKLGVGPSVRVQVVHFCWYVNRVWHSATLVNCTFSGNYSLDGRAVGCGAVDRNTYSYPLFGQRHTVERWLKTVASAKPT